MDEAENWLDHLLKNAPELDNPVGCECLWEALAHSHDRSDEAIIELAKKYLENKLISIGFLKPKIKFKYELVPESSLRGL